MSALADLPEVLRATADLAWPAILVGLLVFAWRKRSAINEHFKRLIAEIVSGRSVSGKFGSFEFSVGEALVTPQEAVDDQRAEIEKLRVDLALLAAQLEEQRKPQRSAAREPVLAGEALPSPPPGLASLLWVDDKPEHNTYERAVFTDRKVSVTIATSNKEAFERASTERFDLVIINLRRPADQTGDEVAGFQLVSELSELDYSPPVLVYVSDDSFDQHRQVLQDGAIGITSDSTTLFQLAGLIPGPASGIAFEQRVMHALNVSPSIQVRRPSPDGDQGIDGEVVTQGRRIAIEAKAWVRPPTPALWNTTLAKLRSLPSRYDEVWLVVPSSASVPRSRDEVDPRIRIRTLGELTNMA